MSRDPQDPTTEVAGHLYAGHLDEVALEALSSGRSELVSTLALEHLGSCDVCAERVESEVLVQEDANVALRRTLPALTNLDAMVSQAMTCLPEVAAGQAVTAGAAVTLSGAPTRRSMRVGVLVGGLMALALGTLRAGQLTSAGEHGALAFLGMLGRQFSTLLRASDGLVENFVPGGWLSLSVLGLGLSLLLSVPLRGLLGFGKTTTNRAAPWLTSALSIAILLMAFSQPARAYHVEGALPDTTVSVHADEQPTSTVLRQVAEQAGLGVVMQLPEDPIVSLHIADAPLSEVLQALLGHLDVVLVPQAHLLTVRPEPAAIETLIVAPPIVAPPIVAPPIVAPPAVGQVQASVEPAVSAPAVAPSVGNVADLASLAEALEDRFSLGEDTQIESGESVRSVYTMGGDAQILGRAFGDVVTMGGDAQIRGEVVGNVMTMGGDIELLPGAKVLGDLNAMGGEIEVSSEASVLGGIVGVADNAMEVASSSSTDSAESSWSDFGSLDGSLSYALLFLLGLLMLGPGGQRLQVLRSELRERPVKSALSGLLGIVGGSLLVFVLTITLIGIPAALALALVMANGVFIGLAAAAFRIGGAIPGVSRKDNPVLQLGVGVALLFGISLVPTVGGMLINVIALAGLGAVMTTSFGKKPTVKRPRHTPTGPFR